MGEDPDERVYRELIADIEAEFPGFRIVRKHESALHRLIHKVLVVVTFGQMRAYLDGYQTTLGQRVYVTSDWDRRPALTRLITMRHERVHMRQFRRFTFAGMALLYVFVPFPLGLAYFRARFEWEAYAESIRATAEHRGLEAASDPALREHILGQFTGPSYGWMWPFRKQLDRWYDRVIAELRSSPG